jgi:8-oxo-dGTP pyrophosphatase MutT (NUDIX family)
MAEASVTPTDAAVHAEGRKLRPRDASTLILIDRSAAEPKVLMGRRHSGHVFMPDKLVFPGGRVDPTDHRIALATPLHPGVERQLTTGSKRSAARGRALAVAAVRELYEETGLCLGVFAGEPPHTHDLKLHFNKLGLKPDLGALRLVARAVTPPGRVRRYDTFFFAAEAGAVHHSIRDVIGADTELVELVWLPIAEAEAADVPSITKMVLGDLREQLAAGFGPGIPVPFYRFERGARQRDLF